MFVRDVEPRLLQALVAAYGPREGREATVDALSWAWEHWDRLGPIANKVGYLYRVGQSATRRYSSRAIPLRRNVSEERAAGGYRPWADSCVVAPVRTATDRRGVDPCVWLVADRGGEVARHHRVDCS